MEHVSGPNYLLPKAPGPVKSRRKRLRVDAVARQAGQAILETGTRVEIFGEEERWWPATIMERTEDTDGRLVHRVQYTNFEGDRYWHVLDDERWRRVADTGPELDHARTGDAALRDDATLAAARLAAHYMLCSADVLHTRREPPPCQPGQRLF